VDLDGRDGEVHRRRTQRVPSVLRCNGVSQLVETINHARPKSAVGFTLVGPFYRANAPMRKWGESIAGIDTKGDRVRITGRVSDLTTDAPVAGAMLDVWQAATNGLYENQDKNQPDYNLRGRFRADEMGTFELVALLPTPYPVPTDGPVGELMRLAKRQPNRPAHIHFIVSAPKYETLVTQVFRKGDDIIMKIRVSRLGITLSASSSRMRPIPAPVRLPIDTRRLDDAEGAYSVGGTNTCTDGHILWASAYSASLCQRNSRIPPGFRRMLIPASSLATGSSRSVLGCNLCEMRKTPDGRLRPKYAGGIGPWPCRLP
jgi:protocatechuate 3,4-dioxygenase beta subunit